VVAAAAFVAIFFLDVPFPLIVLGAALAGYAMGLGRRLGTLAVAAEDDPVVEGEPPIFPDRETERTARPALRRGAGALTLGLVLWWAPVAALALWLGGDSVYTEEGTFFSVAALVTFGGAYAVLAYVAQEAVQTYGWVTPGEMLDGLGMAETTPGPLILVVQFVGFMGAYRAAEGLDPLLAGVAGAVLVAWVTFVPSFLWIFLGAPYVEYLRGNRRLAAALAGVTAAVVGVILNLAVWFALHVLFEEVGERNVGPLRLYEPEWSSLDPVAAALTIGAFYLLFRRGWSILVTLGASAAAGAALSLAGLAG
jgi:chromate transporter